MGREIALELGRCGAVVVCVDIREDSNQETMRLVQQQRQGNIKIEGIPFHIFPDATHPNPLRPMQIQNL